MRLAFEHHKRLAVGLQGVSEKRTIGDLFQSTKDESLVDMLGLDLIIGSGGVLSHAPERRSAAFMLLDAYQPEGVTQLAVDSIFMMPHLGVFSTVHPEAAQEIFLRDCLVNLGTVIAPVGKATPGASLAKVSLDDGREFSVRAGELTRAPLDDEAKVGAKITPLSRRIDVGAGPGRVLEKELIGGHAGLIFDGRGRPLTVPQSEEQRSKRVAQWYRAFDLGVGD